MREQTTSQVGKFKDDATFPKKPLNGKVRKVEMDNIIELHRVRAGFPSESTHAPPCLRVLPGQ